MHVEPKHIATGAVMTVLLALFLFWQGDADGMDQQTVQMEQGASDGRSPDQAGQEADGCALREDTRHGEPGGHRGPAQSVLARA